MSTIVAGGTVNPQNIVSGQKLRIFDNSTATGTTVNSVAIYINEQKTCTCNNTTNISITNASTYFSVGDTIIWYSPPYGFSLLTTYWVVFATSTFIRLAATKGGTPISAGSGTFYLFMGCMNIPFPTLRPFPVTTAQSRNVVIVAFGADGTNNTVTIPFYTVLSESSKPASSGYFGTISIFIYSSTNATVLNRKWVANNGLIFSDLAYTDSINVAGTASFTVTARGTQTTTEENLLVSDNYVAIIMGNSVVWSGKILRSEQAKMTLYSSSSTVKQWEIECESDIGKVRLQNIKDSYKGVTTGSIGSVMSKVLEGTGAPAVNWNGSTIDPALRSSEGPQITYPITNADMFSQLSTLRNVIDFDVHNRLIYQRYSYISFSGTSITVTSTSPYATSYFAGKWVVFTTTSKTGVTSYGKCSSAGANTINFTSVVNPSLPGSTGTVLVLGDPVLDIVSDLSQQSIQATFYMNSPRQSTPSFGYEFNDKTDRKALATKVVAKGKLLFNGETDTATVAAVSPWDKDTCCFESATTITKRSEGIIVDLIEGEAPAGASTLFLDGWGYAATSGSDLLAIARTDGVFTVAQDSLRINSLSEIWRDGKRVTEIEVNFSFGSSVFKDGIAFIIKWAEKGVPSYGTYPNAAGRIYISPFGGLNYTAGMDVYIGGETITTTDTVLDTVNGLALRYVCSGATNHRAPADARCHIPGCLVWKKSIYSETSPVIGSPLYYHGLILNTFTSDQGVMSPTLEMYATMHLIANSYYYRKASFWCPVFDFYRTDARPQYQQTAASPLRAGDRVYCRPKSTDTETETLYGQLKNVWQIISYTLDANSMVVTVELGDFERNVFTLIADKTASINSTIT